MCINIHGCTPIQGQNNGSSNIGRRIWRYAISTIYPWSQTRYAKIIHCSQSAQTEKGKDFITDIKITAGGNSPIAINNKDSWFENKLNEYLHQYLGVNSLEEAQDELHFIYGDKKVGSKKINPIQSLYIWGTYQLLQDTHLKSVKEKVPTRPQANLIESYLRAIELIEADDVDTDANNIRSRLSYFLNRYDTAEALLDYKTFKLSPYNIGGTKLW